MALPTSVPSFWSDGIEKLPDNYYTENQSVCDICKEDEAADAPDLGSSSSETAISLTEVVKISSCNHIFHAQCLQLWLSDLVQSGRDGTCPKCRRVLIQPHPTEHMNPDPLDPLQLAEWRRAVRAEDFRRLQEQLHHMSEETLRQSYELPRDDTRVEQEETIRRLQEQADHLIENILHELSGDM
jgi:hypothetical protein